MSKRREIEELREENAFLREQLSRYKRAYYKTLFYGPGIEPELAEKLVASGDAYYLIDDSRPPQP